VAIPWDAIVYGTNAFWSAGSRRPSRSRLASRKSASRATHRLDLRRLGLSPPLGGLFFGAAKESVLGRQRRAEHRQRRVNVTPGDYFELIARQISGGTKNVAADEFTWFAIKVLE
jgi:hypothetical protein